MEQFGDRLRRLRQKHNLTLEKLGEYFGISKNATSSWETGKSKPSSDDLLKLAILFNTSTDYLLRGIVPNQIPEGMVLVPLEDALKYERIMRREAEKALVESKNYKVVSE